jgi:hypothetical protein
MGGQAELTAIQVEVEALRNGRSGVQWEAHQASPTRKQEQTAAYQALHKLWARNLRPR